MGKIFADKKMRGWLLAEMVVMVVYAWFSFGLMTPNLILSSNQIYWNWQVWMSATFYNNRVLTAWIFFILISLMWVAYAGLGAALRRRAQTEKVTGKEMWWLVFWGVWPLIFSYNALSADVFNYIFNAKMVVTYDANPHLKVAQDFASDPMLKFMHNSHTTAPYGYAWTAISIPFYMIGLGKFILQWLAMRLASIVSLGGTGWILWKWWQEKSAAQKTNTEGEILTGPWWVLLSPLVLIEIISNNHNDLWMVGLGMLSLWLVWKWKQMNQAQQKKKWWWILVSVICLGVSTQIKFATLALMPFWIYLVWGDQIWHCFRKIKGQKWGIKLQEWGEKYFFDILAGVMFVPLLTNRSQMFHPWYLTWSLMWLPLCRWKWTRIGLVAFSISSLYRYLPFLIDGNYGEMVLIQQKLVTFLGALVLMAGFGIGEKLWQSRKKLK